MFNDFKLTDKINPNSTVLAKLKNNKNSKAFEKDFGSVFQIELEAIESLPEFEELVKREVDHFYDDEKI